MTTSRPELTDRLLSIYRALYAHFGPRHWWPADTPWEVIVGAILTQGVAWRNVERAITSLKTADLLDPAAIHAAPVEEIAVLIRPAGYYRQKAKKLKAFAAHLAERYGGSLEEMFRRPLDRLRPELLGLYGLGPETADSILLYAGGYPVFVIDAYTLRIGARLGLFSPETSYVAAQVLFMSALPPDAALYNEFHAQIDALGHHLCRKRAPRCGQCPLAAGCRAAGEAGLGDESLMPSDICARHHP